MSQPLDGIKVLELGNAPVRQRRKRKRRSTQPHTGLAAGTTPIIVMIESASGVLFAHQIITAAKRVESVI